jgi:hypothetical protein
LAKIRPIWSPCPAASLASTEADLSTTSLEQGDRIGWIFANWVTDYFG